jgi:hypothetical protein
VDVTAQVTWRAGTPVPYSFLVDTFQVSSTTTVQHNHDKVQPTLR